MYCCKARASPCFCVDYRNTVIKFLVQKTEPMPDIKSHIDTVGSAEYITVAAGFWPFLPRESYNDHFGVK